MNDMVLPGTNPVTNVFRVRLRFRLHKFAVCADVKKIFLMVRIQEEDRHCLSYVFRNKDGVIKDYHMTFRNKMRNKIIRMTSRKTVRNKKMRSVQKHFSITSYAAKNGTSPCG